MTINRRDWCVLVAGATLTRVGWSLGLDHRHAQQTRRFMSDRIRNRWNEPLGRLELSRIFDWYAEDFRLGHKGIDSLQRLVAMHAPLLADKEAERIRLQSPQVAIHFLDYDWRLNQIGAAP